MIWVTAMDVFKFFITSAVQLPNNIFTICNSSSTYLHPTIENLLSLLLLSRKNMKHLEKFFLLLSYKEMLSICWCLRRCAEPAHITLDRKTWFKTLVAKSWKLIFSFKAQEGGVVRPISLVTRPIPFKWIYKANSFVLIWKFKICKITSLHNLDIQPLVNLDDLCIYHWLFVIPTERRVQQCTIQSSTQWRKK